LHACRLPRALYEIRARPGSNSTAPSFPQVCNLLERRHCGSGTPQSHQPIHILPRHPAGPKLDSPQIALPATLLLAHTHHARVTRALLGIVPLVCLGKCLSGTGEAPKPTLRQRALSLRSVRRWLKHSLRRLGNSEIIASSGTEREAAEWLRRCSTCSCFRGDSWGMKARLPQYRLVSCVNLVRIGGWNWCTADEASMSDWSVGGDA